MTTIQLLQEQDLYRQELIDFLNEIESGYITDEMMEEMEREYLLSILEEEKQDCPYFADNELIEELRGGGFYGC